MSIAYQPPGALEVFLGAILAQALPDTAELRAAVFDPLADPGVWATRYGLAAQVDAYRAANTRALLARYGERVACEVSDRPVNWRHALDCAFGPNVRELLLTTELLPYNLPDDASDDARAFCRRARAAALHLSRRWLGGHR